MLSIIEDKPLVKTSQDEFGREPLADMIAASIRNVCSSNHGCIVYGIYGKWGEGKTTLMNFVESKLLESGKKDNIYLSHFNPWLLNNDEALLKEFFSTISKDCNQELKKYIRKYGNMVSFASKTILNAFIPGAGVAFSSFVDEVNKSCDGLDDTVAEQKKKVSDAISSSGKHCVVFIDDIDRLDRDELHTVFRLLRQIADFKNTVYVVAMDVDIVSKSLGHFFGKGCEEDGRRFIDKIIQVPIVLPAIPDKLMRLSTRKELSGMLKAYNVSDERIIKIVDTVTPLMKSRRDIVRYINQLYFTFPAICDDVNIEDLCAIEAIKSRNPMAYNLIREKKAALLRQLSSPAFFRDKDKSESEKRKNYDEAVKDICSRFDEGQKEAVSGVLDYMFGHSEYDNQNLIDGKHIQASLFFPLYFIQSIPDEIIPNSKIDELKSNLFVWTQTQIVEWINSNYKDYGENEVERAVLRIIRQGDAKQTSTRSGILVKALSLSDMAKGYGYDSLSNPTGLAITISAVILNQYMYMPRTSPGIEPVRDSRTIVETLSSVFADAELNFCMAVVTSNYLPLSDSEDDKKCVGILVDRFEKLSHAEQLKYSKYELNSLFSRWARYDRSSFDRYVIGLIEDTAIDYVEILNHFIDGENNGDDESCFVLFFEAALPLLNKRISEDKRIDADTNARRRYLSNYRIVLQNNGKSQSIWKNRLNMPN